MTKINIALMIFLALSACTNIASDFLRPAIFVELDNEKYIQVKRKIEELYSSNNILIDKQVFTRSSWLALERKNPRRIQNSYANGRVMERPFKIQLLRKGSRCYLRKEKQEMLHLLQGIDCFEHR